MKESSMPQATGNLALISDELTSIVESASASVVAVHGGARWSSSGIHWRPGVIVTAEEALERDQEIAITTAQGHRIPAALVGRDPTTDVAVLRVPAEGLALASPAGAAALRAGNLILAVGRHEEGALAGWGVVEFAGGAWQSRRGGTIDSLIRLNMRLAANLEGGALVDVGGRILGMVVSGPRGRVLAIPSSTIERAVDQLLSKGHVSRAYLGAGLQPVALPASARDASGERRGVLIVSVDPNGPAGRAGVLVGDVILTWNDTPVSRVRQVMQLLGPDSIAKKAKLELLRGGAPTSLEVTLGERPLT
jgi:S1-C subfamily serine protease